MSKITLRESALSQMKRKNPIGKGSLWLAYKVMGPKKELVLKVSNLTDATKEEEQYLRQEVEILARLKHHHIMEYIDGWCERLANGQLKVYLLMAYANGGNLKEYLRRRSEPPSEAEYGSWLAQIASGLDFIHKEHVIHRNIKTSNIFVCKEGREIILRIADFGMASVLQDKDAMVRSVVGSALYMGPERLNRGEYNSKGDIWSLGCVAYEMATGKMVFEANTITTLQSRVNEAAKLAREIGRRYGQFFQSLIETMLHNDPEKRPDAAAVLQLLQDNNFYPKHRSRRRSSDTEDGLHTRWFNTGSLQESVSSVSSVSSTRNIRSISELKPISDCDEFRVRPDNSTVSSARPIIKSMSELDAVTGCDQASANLPENSESSFIPHLRSMSDSVQIHPVSNPKWEDIDKRTYKPEQRAPSRSSKSSRRGRTKSETTTEEDMSAALAEFTLDRRSRESGRLSKSGPVSVGPRPSDRLSKSGPVQSHFSSPASSVLSSSGPVSLTPRTNTSGYSTSSMTGALGEGDEWDKDRTVVNIQQLQGTIARELEDDAVFMAAYSTLNIEDDDKFKRELKNVLGEKQYEQHEEQFATLRRLERRSSEQEQFYSCRSRTTSEVSDND